MAYKGSLSGNSVVSWDAQCIPFSQNGFDLVKYLLISPLLHKNQEYLRSGKNYAFAELNVRSESSLKGVCELSTFFCVKYVEPIMSIKR